MKIKVSPYLDNMLDVNEFRRYQTIFNRAVTDTLNGNLTFQDNLRGQILTFNFTGSGVNLTVRHELQITPQYYLPIRLSQPMQIYDGSGTVFTTESVTLRSSAAGTATILVLV